MNVVCHWVLSVLEAFVSLNPTPCSSRIPLLSSVTAPEVADKVLRGSHLACTPHSLVFRLLGWGAGKRAEASAETPGALPGLDLPSESNAVDITCSLPLP